MRVSIILAQDNLPEAIPFYCMRCRNMLFKINRDVLVISFGTAYPSQDIPKGMGWVDIQCHSCKTSWNFYWQ